MKVNERRTVVGGGLIGHCVPPTVERDRRAWSHAYSCSLTKKVWTGQYVFLLSARRTPESATSSMQTGSTDALTHGRSQETCCHAVANIASPSDCLPRTHRTSYSNVIAAPGAANTNAGQGNAGPCVHCRRHFPVLRFISAVAFFVPQIPVSYPRVSHGAAGRQWARQIAMWWWALITTTLSSLAGYIPARSIVDGVKYREIRAMQPAYTACSLLTSLSIHATR